MISEPRYSQMKAKIPDIKQLFQSRHYIQCAALCERLLTRSNEIHPLHQAYLNFYLALSHDTMAREAAMKNRRFELDLAEKHYLAAIAVLSPPETQRLEDIQEFHSPTSSEGNNEFSRRRASDAASLNSDRSISTSATSITEEEQETTDSERMPKKSVSFDDSAAPQIPKSTKRRPSPIRTSPPFNVRTQFSSDMSSFISMVKSHLAGVRELKESSGQIHRYSFSRSRSSTLSSRPVSRASTHEEWDKVRLERRSMSFRPRFDPTGVQKLCTDALSEL